MMNNKRIYVSMPLEDPRREKFAQERAYGMSAERAYAAAGYSKSNNNAHRMDAYPVVQKRIQKIKEERALLYQKAFEMSVQKIGLEKADIARMLLEDREAAKQCKQFGTAVSCVKLLGEMIGAFTREDTSDKAVPLDGISGERLKDILNAIDERRETGTKEPDPGSIEVGIQSQLIS